MKSALHISTASKATQKGFTIIELLIVVAIIGVLGVGANIGLGVRNDQVGRNEGNIVNAALQCVQTKNSNPTYAAVTLASVSNLGCFPDENITGKGTATATAISGLVGTDYVVSPVNLNGTNDGLSISIAGVSKKNCTGMVKAVSASSSRVTVTPLAGTASVVKAVGATLDDAALGLACGSADTATVAAVIGKS